MSVSLLQILTKHSEIVGALMQRWSSLLAVNKEMVRMMLAIDEAKANSALWRMTAIQVLALCESYDIPLLDDTENAHLAAQRGFALDERVHDRVLAALLSLLDARKKPLVFAASETLGKLLSRQPGLYGQCAPVILSGAAADQQVIFLSINKSH